MPEVFGAIKPFRSFISLILAYEASKVFRIYVPAISFHFVRIFETIFLIYMQH